MKSGDHPGDTDPPPRMTLEEGRAFLRTHYPALAEITDELDRGGLKLIRFEQSPARGRMTGSLRFAGLPHDYLLGFALQPSEVQLFRCDGAGGLIPISLTELSAEAVSRAIWADTLR